MAVALFGLQRSVYTRIARLALVEKQVPHALHEVEIFGPSGVPQEHLARHPFGRIPVLEHDGFRLFETAAITRYVDEAFHGPALQPAGAGARARMHQTLGVLDSYAYRPMVWGVAVERLRKPTQGQASDEAAVARSLIAAGTVLKYLEQQLAHGAFLAGDALTLADLHAYPMLCLFGLAPDGRAALGQHARVGRWFADMRQRGSVRDTRSTYETEA